MISGVRPTETHRYVMHAPTDPRAKQLMHVGFLANGAIVGQRGGTPVVLTEGSRERAYLVSRKLIGAGWERLPPGTRPAHLIVGKLSDGTMLSVACVELVYNDAKLVDDICGDGFYSKLMDRRRESEALEIARKLWKEPIILAVSA
jgi:hypothetical protein